MIRANGFGIEKGSRILQLILFFLLGLVVLSNGQEGQNPPQNTEPQAPKTESDFMVRIAVEEVRLDVVILDNKGKQITDLTANDFEIYQNDRPQKILSCTYITDQTAPSARPAASPRLSRDLPPIPARELSREKVRRVIAFVVDDLSMSFENIHYARLSLTRFVENQMEPGDLVAILRTASGNSALQMFLSDKRQLLARIDNVRWGMNAGRMLESNNLHVLFDGQLSAMRYCIRALKDMPGRKALILMTAQTTLPGRLFDEALDVENVDYQVLYSKRYGRLADEALRAGVVVHTLDIRGLEAPVPDPSLMGGGVTLDQISQRNAEMINPLTPKTGGLFLANSNWFNKGIGEVNDALKGYYLLSYSPPSTTFKPNRREIYHRVKIKVKRPGAEVHTRDGFYGAPETADEAAITKNPLREAIFSPFRFSDLKVNLASGYVHGPQTGYLVRSWLHLDMRDLNMIRKKGEGFFISLETVSVTSDINGSIQDSSIVKYEFRVKEQNLPYLRDNGIKFSLFLPVKKPGAYHLRVAVKDLISGKIGSAYQFVEIPDLENGRLALSNIFLINRGDDLSWIQSGATKEDTTQKWLYPVLARDVSRSPALRSYRPGDSFEYMAVVYNAKSNPGSTPELSSQFVLYKNGNEFLRSEPEAIDLNGVSDFTRIPIKKKLQLENTLTEGDYALQLLISDKRADKKRVLAAQALNFEILGK